MTKWKYKVITLSVFGKDFTKDNERELNGYGKRGWELVNFCVDGNKMDGSFYKLIFKKRRIL